jgi:hypothetical protein
MENTLRVDYKGHSVNYLKEIMVIYYENRTKYVSVFCGKI